MTCGVLSRMLNTSQFTLTQLSLVGFIDNEGKNRTPPATTTTNDKI